MIKKVADVENLLTYIPPSIPLFAFKFSWTQDISSGPGQDEDCPQDVKLFIFKCNSDLNFQVVAQEIHMRETVGYCLISLKKILHFFSQKHSTISSDLRVYSNK